MSLPEPPSSVDNGCSVVHDNTLYVFTPTAFMALSLEEDAEWEELEMGQQVTGGVCVGTDAELFVVGGTGGPADYNGLQKFIFADKKWETIPADNPAFRNLQFHGAAYIKNANRIVVAGGNQDGREAPSQNTYYFDLANAMNIMSAAGAPPVISPVVIPWSDDAACILWDKEVRTFASGGWVNNDVTLSEPIPPSSKALVLAGDDGSKSLYVFDLAASPNMVHRYAVWGANNQGIQGAVDANANAKRDLSLNDWPDYNSTLAPTITRAQGQYSVAQDANGRVVFVGGNADEPLAFFDMKENSWLDAAEIVGEQKILSAESSTATTKTKTSSTKTSSSEFSTKTKSTSSDASSTFATSTASATETDSLLASETISESSSATGTDAASIAGGSSDGGSGLSSNAILGITLGTILGFLALLVVILLLLRRRKKAQQQPSPEKAQPRHDFPSDQKDPMGLGGAPVSPFRGHHSNMSQESFSSMTILMGGAGKKNTNNNKVAAPREVSNLADEKEMGFGASPAAPHFRNHVSTMSQDSQSSMAILMGRAGKGNGNNRNSVGVDHKQLKSTISKPILQEAQYPTVQGQDAKGVAFDPNVAEPRSRNGPLETQDGLRRSSGWNRYWSGGSALQILGFGGPPKRNTVSSDTDSHYSEQPGFRNPRVTQDSATVPPLNFEFRPEMNRVNSGSPVVSEYSKNIPFRDGVAGKIERPISKTSSGYSSGIPESVNETWDSDYKDKPWGTDRATSSIYNPSFYFGQPLSPRVPPPQTPPSGVSTQPQLAMASQSNDMSWLNLGDRARQ